MNELWTESIISNIFTRVINDSCHNRPALKSQWLNTKVFIPIHTTSSTAVEGDWGWRRLRTVIQLSRLVNSSSHGWSIWNMWLGGHHGKGREEVVEAGHVTSLMVIWAERGTSFPIVVSSLSLSLAFIYTLSVQLAVPTSALPWKQTFENSPSHW